MSTRPSSLLAVTILAGWLSLSPACFSQSTSSSATTPASSGADTSPAARLREYEATYQAGLRKIQTPLLTDYMLKLQQLLVSAPPSDQAAITSEIERVKKIVASGAVIDLRSASQPQNASPTPMPPPGGPPPPNGNGKGPPPGARPFLGAVLVLKPDSAKGPAVLGSAITIGRAQWTVEHLEAGTYDISVVLSFPAFTGKASIVASLAGDEAREDLSESKAATSSDQFRLLRIGKVKLDEDVNNKDLTLSLDSTALAGVQIRQVIISRPRMLAK